MKGSPVRVRASALAGKGRFTGLSRRSDSGGCAANARRVNAGVNTAPAYGSRAALVPHPEPPNRPNPQCSSLVRVDQFRVCTVAPGSGRPGTGRHLPLPHIGDRAGLRRRDAAPSQRGACSVRGSGRGDARWWEAASTQSLQLAVTPNPGAGSCDGAPAQGARRADVVVNANTNMYRDPACCCAAQTSSGESGKAAARPGAMHPAGPLNHCCYPVRSSAGSSGLSTERPRPRRSSSRRRPSRRAARWSSPGRT